MEIFMYVVFFIMGAFFGSFFTLAVYRIPLHQDILWKHSYCPNCNHKLGTLDLIPIISYISLKGKCRYCGEKVKIRYLLLEVLSGIVFTMFAISIGIDIYTINLPTIMYIIFEILYFCILFIIAGIDKEKIQIQKNVLLVGIIFASLYMIYVCTLNFINMYRYVMYLFMLLFLIAVDTIFLKRKLYSNYTIQIATLCLFMAMFSGEIAFYLTAICTLVTIAINILIHKIKHIDGKNIPFGFYLCMYNIAAIIVINFLR